MNFVLLEMTFLRYFAPLIIEGNRRGIKSKIYVGWRTFDKYNSPYKHEEYFRQFSEKYDVDLIDISKWSSNDGKITFFIEGVGLHNGPNIRKTNPDQLFVSITSMADYEALYSRYVNLCDYVCFPSRTFADEFGLHNDKNLYLGSPKYDCLDDLSQVDYLGDSKVALVMYPSPLRVPFINMHNILNLLKKNNFEIWMKARAKNPVNDANLHGDRYFVEESWYPHYTLDLINQCDLVVNIDSSTIKESTILEKPMLNFNVKKVKRVYDFLFDCDHCVDLDSNSDDQAIDSSIELLLNTDYKKSYRDAKEKYLWTGNASKTILNHFNIGV